LNFIRLKKIFVNKLISGFFIFLSLAIVVQSLALTGLANAAVMSDLTATIDSVGLVTLNWKDFLSNEKNYIIDRKTDSGEYVTLAWAGPNTTSYIGGWLIPGHTYTFRIRALDSSSIDPYIYTDELSLRPDDIATPDSLVITSSSSTQVDLKWSYPNQKSCATIIERRTENDTKWSEVARVAIGQNTFSDTSINSGTNYYYRVRAYYSDRIKTTAYPNDDIGILGSSLLQKPTNLSCLVLSWHRIQLKWQDNSNETTFVIERKAPGDGNFKEIAVVPQNVTTYIDEDDASSPVASDLLYTYRIKAVTGSTNSEYSDEISVTSTYLGAPSTLSGSFVDGQRIRLLWKDTTYDETGFEIWRRVGTSAVWELYATMGKNAVTYTDTSVSEKNSYSYKIRAKINDNTIYSDFSNEATIWATFASAPANLKYSITGTNEVQLTWDDKSASETGYKVERKTGDFGQWSQVAQLDANTTKYTDRSLSKSEVYYYRVYAYDTLNTVNYSNTVQVSLATPEAPSNLSGNAISSNEVQLNWQDNSKTESGFIIELLQGNIFKTIGNVGSDITTYTYRNVNPNTTLTFQVKAINGANQSKASNQVTVTTKKGPVFSDLGSVKWAQTAITDLASRNVFDVNASSKFYPTQRIARGEFCAIIIRSLELNKVAAGKYADVTPKNRYYQEIMTAAKLGIITADKGNRIYPDKAITREQAAIMLARAMKIKDNPLPQQDSSSLKQFVDYRSIPAQSADMIAAVCGAGIFTGRQINGKTYLQINGYVTRAEAAVMLYKAVNL
jgi:hypothetical protein